MSDVSPFFGKHSRIACCYSGGKDSLAVVYMLRPHLADLTIYHLDTGDLLPEMRESAAHVESFAPNFIRVNTNVTAWIEQHGLPTDLLPHSAHPIGQAMGEGPKLVARYDCCWANLMSPLYQRIKEDGNTLLIRGTKAVDMRALPMRSGETADDGIEFWYPLQDWTNEQVFSYLKLNNAPIPRVYDYVDNSPECAQCSAWWGEKRGAYLRKYHPELWRGYGERLRVVTEAIDQPIANLQEELKAFAKESV